MDQLKTENQYKEFKKEFDSLINNSKEVYITAHINPDGDAISSVLSVYYYITEVLKHPKDKVFPIFTGKHDDNWAYFKNYDRVEFVDDIVDVVKEGTTIVFLDGKETYRFTNKAGDLKKIKDLKTVCIDHHPSPNTETFDIFYTVEKTKHMSNAEIIYAVFFQDQLKDIPVDICEVILLGIYSDSGGFRYINGALTNCMLYCAEIIKEKNIEPDMFLSTLFTPRVGELNAEACLLANLKKQHLNGWPNFSYTFVTKGEAKKHGAINIRAAKGNIKDCIKYLDGTNWSFVFVPNLEQKRWDFSFRSTPTDMGQVNVKDIALTFGGGGHNAAAGMSLDDAKYWNMDHNEMLNEIITYLKTHKPTYID